MSESPENAESTEREPAPDASELAIPEALAGERLDRALASLVPGMSRARLQAIIAGGHVRVGGKPAKPALRVAPGQVVHVAWPPVAASEVVAEALPIAIVYQDADLAVIDKPQGMVVHPAPGSERGTLVNALLHHLSDLSGIGGALRPGIVHRLDKDTSGLLVVAKHDRSHRDLAAQIAAKTALRRYWAIVRGAMPEPEGRVEAPIGRHPGHRQKMAVVPGGRPAATRWKTLEAFRGFSLLELTLETGRTHQIRVHLAHLGHPVVGDPLYGGDLSLPVKLAGQALHARELAFTHPTSGLPVSFSAPPPATFEKLLAYLRETR